MKQFIITMLVALLAANGAFAQTGKKARIVTPMMIEEPVHHITVEGNIDVLLIEDAPMNVGVKLPVSALDKIVIRMDGNNLYLTASSKLAANERVYAYITVNDLNSLEIKGNVIVRSEGVLESQQLLLKTNEKALVSLRTDGPIIVASPASYQVVKEKNFYSVFAGNL